MKQENDHLDNKSNQMLASDFMPQDEYTLSVLINRGHILAQEEIVNEQKSTITYYIRFKLGNGSFYGIPYEKIQEVVNNYILTPVPNVPAYIVGVMNLRGTLTAVIDLKLFFHIPNTDSSKGSQIIIVKALNMIVGIIVDSIEGKDSYELSLLDTPISKHRGSSEYIIGISQGNTAIINMDTTLANLSSDLAAKSQGIL
jgi:purine-binding chemotaxis protein CheW